MEQLLVLHERFGYLLVPKTNRIENLQISFIFILFSAFWPLPTRPRGAPNGLGRRSDAQSITEDHPRGLRKTPGSRKEPTKDTTEPPGTPEMLPRDRMGAPRRGGRRSCTAKTKVFLTFSKGEKFGLRDAIDGLGRVWRCHGSSLDGLRVAFGSSWGHLGSLRSFL